MSTNNPNIANLAADFMGLFHGRHMILFAGRKTNDSDFSNLISELPWSCVITSRTDSAFGDNFIVNDRRPREYTKPADVPSRPLSKQGELPILRISGMVEQLDDEVIEELALTGQTVEEYLLDKTREMLRLVPGLFDGANIMVVIGYDPSTDGEIPYRLFAPILNNNSIHDGKVHFWGLDSTDSQVQLLQKLSEKKGFVWHEQNLRDIIEFWKCSEINHVDTRFLPSEGDELFYKGGQTVGISPSILLQYRYFANLLTEQTVTAIRPYGRLQQARWYYNFLTLSSTDGPQWYGYLKNSEFYLHRDYEDALVNLVEKQISGNDPADNGPGSPIILFGDPCSSKSITLGALAYRIFNKHINPVIFIKNDTLMFTNDSSETVELANLMEAIDKIGPDMRILLIWDCSSYRNVATNAKRLSKILTDRGRRFVLVCSAYDDPNPREEIRTFFHYECAEQKGGYSTGTEKNYDIFFCNGCYYVPATRKLSPREQHLLWQKFTEFSGTPKDQLTTIRSQISEESNIFDYFYKIISLLRPSLEQSLTREEAKVNQYVREQLSLLEKGISKQTQSTGSVAQAFAAAGIDLSAYGIDVNALSLDTNATSDQEDYDLHRFNTCIALFSRFKIEVSYSLAMQMLKVKERCLTDFSVNYNQKLFDLMTTRIPWLRYGESKSGNDYSFSFRNTLEAELFLSRNKISGEKQVELLCDILEMYGAYYQVNHYLLDPSLEKNIQQLIRLMGPNSQYPPFRGEKSREHREILMNIEPIISMLEVLCMDYKIPDNDAGFATILVTLTREYYGSKWKTLYAPDNQSAYSPERYLYRIEKLHSMLQFATDKIEKLEFAVRDARQLSDIKHLSDQRNGLTVELAHCNVLLRQLRREYIAKCTELGHSISTTMDYCDGLSYKEIYNQLYNVILNNPSNGHAYNALFKAFEEMYENSALSEPQKLQYLSEIKLIADDCGSVDIRNRGADERDEIKEHLQRISQYSNHYKVSIDDICNNTVNPAFYVLYQNMLEANSSAAVTFVCQQELEQAKINYSTDKLTPHQLIVCKKIMCFMREDQNAACISGNYYALNLLLRVTWMSYTGQSMKDSPECQLIKMSPDQWADIRQISNNCIVAANRQAINRAKPLVVLINALATLHVTGDYIGTNSIINSLTEDQFYFSARMKVPFIICDENGPILHSGYVLDTNGFNGYINLSDVPQHLGGKNGVRFHLKNLGPGSRMPDKNQRINNLELGLGYTGFSVYTKAGREYRGGQS